MLSMHFPTVLVLLATVALDGAILWATISCVRTTKKLSHNTIYATAVAAVAATSTPVLLVLGAKDAANQTMLVLGAVIWAVSAVGLVVTATAHYQTWLVASSLAQLGDQTLNRLSRRSMERGATGPMNPNEDASELSEEDMSIENFEMYDLRFERFKRRLVAATPGLAERQAHKVADLNGRPEGASPNQAS